MIQHPHHQTLLNRDRAAPLMYVSYRATNTSDLRVLFLAKPRR